MKHSRNVLVLCGGKWVGMTIQLKEAMGKVELLRDGLLIVADKAEVTPAGVFADRSVTVPPISDPTYIDNLRKLCVNWGIRVIVPLIDLDLERLSSHLYLFGEIGVSVVCPSEALVDLCMDKVLFRQFVLAESLPYPVTYGPDELDTAAYPLFYKPARGYGSRNTGICKSYMEAKRLLREWPDLIFQEYLSGDEVSVDGYISVSGEPLLCVPRKRDKIVGGEAYQSHTIQSDTAYDLALQTMRALAKRGLHGPVNIQMFLTGKGPYLIEVNTRLGSASVLSNVATHGKLFEYVLEEACGIPCTGEPYSYVRDLALYRFLGDLFYKGPNIVKVVPLTKDENSGKSCLV